MVRLTAWLAAVAGAAVWLWSDVGSWPATPEEQAIAAIRVVAALLASWLLLATVLAIVGRALRVRWLDVLAPAVVRRLVAGALAGGLLVAPGVAAAGEPPPGVEAPVLQRVDEPAADLRAPEVAIAPEVRGEPEGVPRVHVVEPGDHLWGIAEVEVAARLGRPPSDAEVVPYWRELIEASRTVVGPDPNVIRPGQRIDLPS